MQLSSSANNVIQFGAQALTEQSTQQLKTAFNRGEVFVVDVDTNNDFFSFSVNGDDPNPENRIGLPVPGAGEKEGEGIRPNITRLTDELIKGQHRLRIATLDTMGRADEDAEHTLFTEISKEHCVKGTEGHSKIPETVIDGERVFHIDVDPAKNKPFKGIDLSNTDSVYFEKNAFNFGEFRPDISTMDTIENPAAKQLLEQLTNYGYKVAVVYGLATDFCVKGTVETLKKFGFTPFVVNDAVKAVDPAMDELLTTDPENEHYNDETYGDVTVLSTDDVLKLSQRGK